MRRGNDTAKSPPGYWTGYQCANALFDQYIGMYILTGALIAMSLQVDAEQSVIVRESTP
jgi:hypothetical protein